MYRPGGFMEYSPSDQRKFDKIIRIIKDVFEQHNFQHIWTPAVEPVDILKKWWDIIDKQVYGLFGLAQWVEDVKDYALHFDLTVPLARYVLDHRNELVFPFRRYQMQPVWRWERTKRGRYKEFWQFDVDAIWPSESNTGMWYDIETIYVLENAFKKVLGETGIKINYKLQLSHLLLTKNWLLSKGIDDPEIMNQILKSLDDYYKIERKDFENKISILIGSKDTEKELLDIIDTQDPNYPSLQGIDGHHELMQIIEGLQWLWVSLSYNICIVRWHGYYKGMVCEWFDMDDMWLGSLAWGWRYNHLTDFIDNKQSYSWVGTSIGRFVPAVIEKMPGTEEIENYLFVNFQETYTDILSLYKRFISRGEVCELYPISAKLGKQFEYADRKKIRYCVILWPGEIEQNQYKIKDLSTWKEIIYDL